MKKRGSVKWKCPSNIALIKYWGKFGRQYPKNPSISFTLSHSHTITEATYTFDNNMHAPDLEFLFEGQRKPQFEQKVKKYLLSISDELPIINKLSLKIDSQNSFPHSSGIASSASSMAALAMCLLNIEKDVVGKNEIDLEFASHLARLGSGSASRSIFPIAAVWGESALVPKSSNAHAIPFSEQLHPIFHTFRDDILIVSDSEKPVSSRMGHSLMDDNPYASARFNQAFNHFDVIINAMKEGDLDTFGMIVEKEALTLHALMMSSSPPFVLLHPNTLNIIKEVQSFRNDTMVPVYFTLDAGPNLHLLYPSEFEIIISELKSDLKKYCFEGRIIDDGVGLGPERN